MRLRCCIISSNGNILDICIILCHFILIFSNCRISATIQSKVLWLHNVCNMRICCISLYKLDFGQTVMLFWHFIAILIDWLITVIKTIMKIKLLLSHFFHLKLYISFGCIRLKMLSVESLWLINEYSTIHSFFFSISNYKAELHWTDTFFKGFGAMFGLTEALTFTSSCLCLVSLPSLT